MVTGTFCVEESRVSEKPYLTVDEVETGELSCQQIKNIEKTPQYDKHS